MRLYRIQKVRCIVLGWLHYLSICCLFAICAVIVYFCDISKHSSRPQCVVNDNQYQHVYMQYIPITRYNFVRCSLWRHQMETFPRYRPFVRGVHRSPVNSPHKGQWRGAWMFSLIYAWINGSVNNREAGDLRRHRAHYGVIVMILCCCLMAVTFNLCFPVYGHLHSPNRNTDRMSVKLS